MSEAEVSASNSEEPEPRSRDDGRVPAGFLLVSEATVRLYRGIWGSLTRANVVAAVKKKIPRLSAAAASRRSFSTEYFATAAVEGKLPIYVVADPELAPEKYPEEGLAPAPTKEPVMVPVGILKRLIQARGGLPDHPIGVSLKAVANDLRMFVLLRVGLLVVPTNDFERWYRSERSRGKWQSQRKSSKRGVGRPRKQDAWRNAVLAIVNDGSWTAKQPISKLSALLKGSECSNVPSEDTLGRLVNNLSIEIADPDLVRAKRRSPRASRKISSAD